MKSTEPTQMALFTTGVVWPGHVQRRAEQAEATLEQAQRPRTVADCAPGGPCHVRPCPWVTCRYHLLVTDVREDGTLVTWRADRLPGRPKGIAPVWHGEHDEGRLQEQLVESLDTMPHTCALDVARDLTGDKPSAEEVGDELGIGGWAALDAERSALATLAAALGEGEGPE